MIVNIEGMHNQFSIDKAWLYYKEIEGESNKQLTTKDQKPDIHYV